MPEENPQNQKPIEPKEPIEPGEPGEPKEPGEPGEPKEPGDGLTDEQREAIIQKAISEGRVVDYESRFKPVYGALKHAERELEAAKQGRNDKDRPIDQITSTTPKPKSEDFSDYDKYLDARDEWHLKQIEARRQESYRDIEKRENQKKWDEAVSRAAAKDPQFIEKGYIPTGMVHLLAGTDHLIDFAYHFGEHPEEAQRIMNLNPTLAAREIGKLEAGFKYNPPAKNKTKAPNPTTTRPGRQTLTRDPADMTYEEYKQWRKSGSG